ncbi:MAG: hypothetical protein JWM81_324 [Candidatus Saccharibacteria bacterium]|nr:hypothetical protein [Candidatus Saccharibacteria bacterium]
MGEDIDQQYDIASQKIMELESGLSVTVNPEITPDERDVLWGIIEQGFFDLNRRSYEKQDMTREEFDADLDSAAVVKFISHDKEGKPLGLLTVHKGLEDIVWTDTSAMAAEQAKVDPLASPYYIGTIVVALDAKGSEAASRMLQGAYLHFRNVNERYGRQSVAFFDCADANYPWLGEFAEKASHPTDGFEGVPLHVKEFQQESWVQTSDGEVAQVTVLPEDAQSYSVLDKQHYYVVTLDTPNEPSAA